jgi:hypothetical protein
MEAVPERAQLVGLLLILPSIAALWTVALFSERARGAAVATGRA